MRVYFDEHEDAKKILDEIVKYYDEFIGKHGYLPNTIELTYKEYSKIRNNKRRSIYDTSSPEDQTILGMKIIIKD